MPLVREEAVRAYVEGRRVAIVANAPEILETEHGAAIDSHDIVVRINRAFPTPANEKAIGKRTDILAGGLIHPLKTVPFIPPWIFWVKRTALGVQHLDEVLRWWKNHPVNVWHLPVGLLSPLRNLFGSWPNSGPACIEAMRRVGAKEIRVFGMTCWGMLEPGQAKHWWQYEGRFKILDTGAGQRTASAEAAWLRENVRKVEPLVYEVKQ